MLVVLLVGVKLALPRHAHRHLGHRRAGLGIGLLPDFSASTASGPSTGAPPLVQVLPDWQVQGFFGERIYALRPWSPQVPKAVQCLVEHLRESFAGGFGAAAQRPAS